MSLREKAVKGVVWSAIESWGGQASQFLTFLVLARLLSPETFGLVSLSNIFIHFIQALLGSGFSTAIVQRQDLEDEHLDTAFWINLAIGVVLTVLGIVSAPAIATFFKQPQITPIIAWLSINVLINSLASIQNAILVRNLAFRAVASRQLGAAFIGSIVGIVMAFLGYGVWSLVCQTLVGNCFGVLLLWMASDWRPGFKVSAKHFKDLFSFGINIVGIGILTFFSLRSDDFLIGYFLGPVALGYYTVAYKLLITIMQLLGDVTTKVALPTFAKLQSEPEKLRHAFYSATKLLCLVAFPSFFGMAVLAPELINGLFGEQWSPSIPVMQVLAGVGVIRASVYFIFPLITAIGKPAWSLWLSCLSTGMKIVAFLVSVQSGIVMVALSLLIATAMVIPAYFEVLRRLTQIKLRVALQQYLVPLVASSIMAFLLIGIKTLLQDWNYVQAELLVYSLLGAIIYAGIIIFAEPELLRRIMNFVNTQLQRRKHS